MKLQAGIEGNWSSWLRFVPTRQSHNGRRDHRPHPLLCCVVGEELHGWPQREKERERSIFLLWCFFFLSSGVCENSQCWFFTFSVILARLLAHSWWEEFQRKRHCCKLQYCQPVLWVKIVTVTLSNWKYLWAKKIRILCGHSKRHDRHCTLRGRKANARRAWMSQ